MLCKKPYVKAVNGQIYGCGQCFPCRLKRRSILTHRILLESYTHACNSFATVTYDDPNLPKDGSLSIDHYQKWIKRLRKAFGKPLRFYIVGEYGEKRQRPHFHAALFGFPPCEVHLGHDTGSKIKRRICKCGPCTMIRNTWNCPRAGTGGLTDNAFLTRESAQYIAGYVTQRKKARGDPDLKGRLPEFSRWSLGLGKEFLTAIDAPLIDGDVTPILQHGRRQMPLGRYLRGKLREMYGMEAKAPAQSLEKYQTSMQELLEKAIAEKKITFPTRSGVRDFLVDNSKQKILNIENRYKIFKKGEL